jgi:hypothetical protein
MSLRISTRVTHCFIQKWPAILLLAALIAVFGLTRVRAAVTLVYFRASSAPNGVFLDWETASELDNLGFFVNRSLSQNSGYSRVSDFIPSSGDPLLGGYYQFTDTNVVNGTAYWYKLESIDTQSIAELYEPPVSAVAGTSRTATPTATRTTPASGAQTGTATATATARTRTPTVTPTIRARALTSTPTFSNPYPAAPTVPGFQQPIPPPPTSAPANQEQATSGILTETLVIPISRTATLIPFPEITMEFPSLSVSEPAIPTPPSIPPAKLSDMLRWVTPARVLIVLFILFVWLFLGGWFYSTIRRLE